MRADSPNWVVLGEPATPAEAAALETLRELLPEDGITRAWVNLTFIDRNGRLAEVDVIVLTKKGLFVVELKGWHGRIDGNQQTWRVTTRAVEHRQNPLLLTDNKAKRLSSVLAEVSPKARLPFIEALVVLHGKDSHVDLDALGRTNVLALNGYNVRGGLPLVSEWLATPPDNPRRAIDLPLATAARKACERAGFRKAPKQRRVGQYVLDNSDPVASGPDWQDFVVTHPVMGDKRRLRLYDVPPKGSKEERERIEQSAHRELRLTQNLRHEGIEAPLDLITTDSGPALLFPFEPDALPLDAFLVANAPSLEFDDRVAMMRQLGEILRYAHNRRLVHRALAPHRVWVAWQGKRLRLKIRDWYTGQRGSGSTGTTTRHTSLSAGIIDLAGAATQDDLLYLAPEALHGSADLPSVPLDVYGWGALAYLILTGQSPAASVVERFAQGYLDPNAVSAAIPDMYAEVVRNATAIPEPLRKESIDDVLVGLEAAVKSVKAPEVDKRPPLDPLDAEAGDVLADRFIVQSRRGRGSTGTALLVVDVDADDERPVILKLALSEAAGRRLQVEAEALARLDHPRVVRLIEGPIEVDGCPGLLLSDAGKDTLAGRIAKEGRATLEQLERYGLDLLEAVAHLDERGVFHRDIKPANLAIAPDPGTRKPRLTLFDLSLSREPLDNISSGTPGYLDPYLNAGGRRRYDRAAELWSVAATLFEMATGSPPWWQDGGAGPVMPDEAPVVAETSFEEALASQFAAFFRRALAPRVEDRFGGIRELAAGWQAVFATLDRSLEQGEGDDEAARAATLATALADAGLSARALSGLSRLDVRTVGDLLGVQPLKINALPGLGERYRKEIQGRIREWRSRLSAPTQVFEEVAGRGVEGVVRALLSVPSSASADRPGLTALLGLPGTARAGQAHQTLGWPTLGEAAEEAGCSLEAATAALKRAVARWSRLNAVQNATTDLVSLLHREGRVMSLAEATASFATQQGSQLEGVERHRQAAALIRALVEVEEQQDEPKLGVRRRESGVPLILLTETADPEGTGSTWLPVDLLAEQAIELGEQADVLVADGVVPAARARAELRSLLLPEARLSDERLVRLAAAVTGRAAASSLGELYPRDLPVAVAIDLALKGRPGRVLTETWVERRVYARFPDLLAAVPKHPALEPLVEAALPGFAWDGSQYVAKSTTAYTAVPSSHLTRLGAIDVPEVDRTLRTSLKQRSALTLGIHAQRYQQAIRTLTNVYAVDVVDVGRMVIEAARDLAAAEEIDWQVVLTADAADRGSFDWEQLTDLIREALLPRWQGALSSTNPLLITHAGPLMRYGLADRLSELLDVGTQRPAARWLLVARDSSTPAPLIEGQSVPLGPSGVVDLPGKPDLLSSTHVGAPL